MANDDMNDFASVDAEMKRRDESIRRLFADMQASGFSHANSYVTVVVFGSYAGMFAVWSNVKDRLSADMTYWTGMLIAISMMSFVAFEIFKMIVLSQDMLAVRKLIIRDLEAAVARPPVIQHIAIHFLRFTRSSVRAVILCGRRRLEDLTWQICFWIIRGASKRGANFNTLSRSTTRSGVMMPMGA